MRWEASELETRRKAGDLGAGCYFSDHEMRC